MLTPAEHTTGEAAIQPSATLTQWSALQEQALAIAAEEKRQSAPVFGPRAAEQPVCALCDCPFGRQMSVSAEHHGKGCYPGPPSLVTH